MAWQYAHLIENSLVSDGKSAMLKALLMLLVIVSIGYYRWKNDVLGWWQRRARLIEFASTRPGPRTIPVIGNALDLVCKSEEVLDRLTDLCTRYESPFRLWLGPKLYVVLTDPQDYEALLKSSNAAFKDSIYRFMEPLIGLSVVSNSGPKQRARRKLIFPMMNDNKSLAIHMRYFDIHSRICADLLEREVGRGDFDVLPYVAHLSMDIMLDTIFGSPGTTQKNEYKDLVHWTERIYGIIHTRMINIWLYSDTLFHLTKLGKDCHKGLETIHNFVDRAIVQKKKEHFAYEKEEGDPGRPRITVLEQLIARNAKINDMDDFAMRSEVYTVFTASQDTTTSIVAFALLMMAIHPDVQDKVREEVNAVLGDEPINERNQTELKYLELVIRETVRLFPIATLLARKLKGDVVLDSCTLPEGCSVIMAPYVTHRSPKYWKDPEKFIPERLLPENSIGRHQYSQIPFSAGPRGCIGQKFAIMCMKAMVANIVQRYRLSSSEKLENIRLTTDISIRSQNGCKLSVTKLNV